MSGFSSEEWIIYNDRENDFVEIEIYADEIILPTDFKNKKRNFIGIGCLFVPLSKKDNLLSRLMNSRCLYETNKEWMWEYENCFNSIKNGGKCKEEWHQFNTCEIHHNDLRFSHTPHSQKEISKKWIECLLENNKEKRDEIYFNILFLDLDVLKCDQFGTQQNHENIYNRFFRTAINYGIKSFFNNEKVIVKKVFQDQGNMESHTYFPYLNLVKLDKELDIEVTFKDTDIAFVDSDHRNYSNQNNDLVEASQFIQFIDLLIGSITQNIYYLSDDPFKKELAMKLRPLVERLLKRPNNPNSSYNYVGRQHISFFPKHYTENPLKYLTTFNLEEIEINKKDMFYTDKKIEMIPYDSKQRSLFSYL